MNSHQRRIYALPTALTALSLLVGITGVGCGNTFIGDSANRPLFVAECDTDSGVARTTSDLYTLQWSGGVSPIYPRTRFEALDFSMFEIAEGGTLADAEDEFKERVRQQVVRIFCEAPGPPIKVMHADADSPDQLNTIYITQSVSPTAEEQVGEGEYDPCNTQKDNAALVFGERLRQMGAGYTFDDWVSVFANVTAHEIGHMLGFGHISRESMPQDGRFLYIELMLDGHTLGEFRQEQRFVVEQTNCQRDTFTSKRDDEYKTVTCTTSSISPTEQP